jgi:hypothetical protein
MAALPEGLTVARSGSMRRERVGDVRARCESGRSDAQTTELATRGALAGVLFVDAFRFIGPAVDFDCVRTLTPDGLIRFGSTRLMVPSTLTRSGLPKATLFSRRLRVAPHAGSEPDTRLWRNCRVFGRIQGVGP